MHGNISDFLISDTMQYLSTIRKTGILKVWDDSSQAKFFLLNGELMGASRNGQVFVNSFDGVKSILADVIVWKSGHFKFELEHTDLVHFRKFDEGSYIPIKLEHLLLEVSVLEDESNSGSKDEPLSLIQIVCRAHLEHFSGKIVVKKEDIERSIFFSKGSLVYIESGTHSETLGKLLLDREVITQEQYKEISKQKLELGCFEGEVIVANGYLTQGQLDQVLTEQLKIKFQNTILLEDPVVSILPGEVGLKFVTPSYSFLFREIISLIQTPFLPIRWRSVSPTEKVVLKAEAIAYFNSIVLNRYESMILNLLESGKTINEIVMVISEDIHDVAVLERVDWLYAFVQAISLFEFDEQDDAIANKRKISIRNHLEALDSMSFEIGKVKEFRNVIDVTDEFFDGSKQFQESQFTAEVNFSLSQHNLYYLELPKDHPFYVWRIAVLGAFHELLKVSIGKFDPVTVWGNFMSIVRSLRLDEIDQAYFSDSERKMAQVILNHLCRACIVLKNANRFEMYQKKAHQRPSRRFLTLNPQETSEILAIQSELFLNKKNFKLASQQILKAIAIAPGVSNYYLTYSRIMIGKAIVTKEPFSKTIEESFLKAKELSPLDYKVHYHLGMYLKSSKRFDESIKCFLESLKLNIGFRPARTSLEELLSIKRDQP